ERARRDQRCGVVSQPPDFVGSNLGPEVRSVAVVPRPDRLRDWTSVLAVGHNEAVRVAVEAFDPPVLHGEVHDRRGIIRAQREEHALVGGHDGPAKAIEHPRPHHARPPSSDNTTLPNGRSSIRWRSAFAASPSGWTRSITGAIAPRSASEKTASYARLI